MSQKINKVINVRMTGGIIGALALSPMRRLDAKIAAANAEGWNVRQVMPSDSGNLFLLIWRIILLCITLFLFTIANGYYIVLEKEVE
jgi:hypothetical protein